MPRLDFRCTENAAHVFERDIPLAKTDYAQRCEFCNARAEQYFPYAPGMFSPSGKLVTAERETYFQHNITYTGGTKEVGFKPNSASEQCQCGNCASHRRRASRTEVADVGKEVRI
jgi:hypothetical protein